MAMSTRLELDSLIHDIGLQITRELPGVLQRLMQNGVDPAARFHLDCILRSGSTPGEGSQKVASLDLGVDLQASECQLSVLSHQCSQVQALRDGDTERIRHGAPRRKRLDYPEDGNESRPNKRRATGVLTISSAPIDESRIQKNPTLHPSTLDKFISGVWESLFSSVRMDPAEVIEQWQAIESSGQPKLLLDSAVATRDGSAFGRINVLTRKISQTSRVSRSLEVIVQAHWIQAFEDRVNELHSVMTKDKAKKSAMSQACVDFNWSEKELRNKMGIWRGYFDIKTHGGWAALVFAGTGLYRFCKYRVAFTDDTFTTLRALRHRFEVAADTLHPRWRSLLAIVGVSTTRKYTGHPHDWVVCGPQDEAIPLPITYHQWDKNFSYTHLTESVIDEDAWGQYDPRTASDSPTCTVCGQHQSDDPQENSCACFPTLYGSPKPCSIPVQVYRTPNGKNNGLLACCAFESGVAVGEFVGEITTGLSNKDVMFGQTDRGATYQIWQGRQGNYSRFVNHSCQPNADFERFMWLGIERTVLVSRGIAADEEVTVDYGNTYWKDLDKVCLCGAPNCRFRNRQERLLEETA